MNFRKNCKDEDPLEQKLTQEFALQLKIEILLIGRDDGFLYWLIYLHL